MGIFTAVVQARLDNSSVGVIKTQIENAVKNSNPSDIKVGVDSAFLQKEVNDALKRITINPMHIKMSGQTQIPTQIQKELDNHKFTISIKDINVAGNIANLGKNVNNAFTDSIEQQLKNGKLDSEIASMQNKLQSAIQSAYKTAGTKADKSFVDFGKTEQEINKLVGDLDFWKKEIASFSASGDTDNLKQAWIEYSNVLDQCKNKLSEMSNLSNSFASSNQVQGLGLDMSTWLEKNGEASDTLKQKVKNLQLQLSALFGNGAVDISAFKELEKEFALIKKEASLDKAPFIANLQKELPSISANISSLGEKIRSLTTKGFDDSSITNYTSRVNELYVDLQQLNIQESIMKDTSASDDARIQAKERYDEIVRKLTSDLTVLANEEKASANNKNILTKIREELDSGAITTKISDLETKLVQLSSKGFNDKSIKDYSQRISELKKNLETLKQLESTMGSSTASDQQKIQAKQKYDQVVKQVTNDLKQLGNEEKQANALSGGFSAMTKSLMSFAASYISVYKVFDVLKQGVSTVVELDDALIDLRKTTVMSAQDLDSFYNGASQIAKDYGSTTKEIIQAAADWSRLGYNTKEQAEEMAKFSSQFATISPGMDINDSTEALTSIMKAYQYEVNDMKDVMSKINKIGNTQAVSNADLSEGLKQAASSFALTGTSFDQLVGLFTSANEVLQDSSRVGNALKTISMRIRGYEEDGSALEENVTGKLYDLTHVSIWADEAKTTYKELGTYMKEVAEIWDDLDASTQTKALETMFGKNRANVGAAIIGNIDAYEKTMQTLADPETLKSADQELAVASESITFHLNQFQNTWTSVAQNLFKSKQMVGVVDVFTSISSVIEKFTEQFGLLGTVVAGGGIVKGIMSIA